jgi:hypothetical protein
MTPEEFSIVIGDWQRACLRAQGTWKDSIEISVSAGSCFMGYRLYPDDCRRLAEYLNRWADRLDHETSANP